MRTVRLLALWGALSAIACGAPVGPGLGEKDAGEAGVELRDGPEPEPELVGDAGTQPIEPEDTRDPCVNFAPGVLKQWPGAVDAFHNAAGRWFRWYRDADEGEWCPLVVRLVAPVARASSGNNRAFIELNPAGSIVDGNECTSGALLIDVLTHELGHVYGLGHVDCDDCAMAEDHEPCETVMPTDSEIAEANGCGDWGPPVGAGCPQARP